MVRANKCRVYSRTGCFQCRRRRKKCGEEQPRCKACARLNLMCSYGTGAVQTGRTGKATFLGPMELIGPEYQIHQLPMATFETVQEEAIVASFEDFMQNYYVPTCDARNRDLSSLVQMIITQPMIRNATIASFSPFFPSPRNAPGDVDRVAYGKALRQIQQAINSDSSNIKGTSLLQTALPFLGFTDTMSADPSQDLTLHWRAFAIVVKQGALSGLIKHLWIPRHIYTLFLESALFNISTLAMFSTFPPSTTFMEGFDFVYQLLSDRSLEIKHWIQESTCMAGFYEPYKLIMEVTYLGKFYSKTVSKEKLDTMEAAVLNIRARIHKTFAKCSNLVSEDRWALMERNYLLCLSLLICIRALRHESEAVCRQIDEAVTEGLRKFIDMEYGLPSLVADVWPILIIACGIKSDQDFEDYMKKWDEFKHSLDFGHRSRAENLLQRIKEIRAVEMPFDSIHKKLPKALYLLKQRNGVLGRL